MSWTELVTGEYIITTGDGREYRPLSVNWQKSTEYNIAEFNFVGLDGTLVEKRRPKGRRFPLEIYFQGDDHLDVSTAFETSAKDVRPWTVTHPYYGRLTVHAASLTFDNTQHNVTKITGVLLETIAEDGVTATVNAPERVAELKAVSDESLAAPVQVDSQVQNTLQTQTTTVYNEGAKTVTGADGNTYFKAFNTASTGILNATNEPLTAMRQVQAMINAPVQFQQSVERRLDTLRSQFDLLTNSLTNALTPFQKRAYEANAGTIVGATATTAVNPQAGDYGSTMAALSVIDQITTLYTDYLTTLDGLQTQTGGSPDSYIPDGQAQSDLNQLVGAAVSGVFDIALNAQQERSVILEYDSDIINLTHRFYGMDATDTNIERFINTNGFGLSQMLVVRANTVVVYYVG
jgi:hypothetical protein